MLLTITLSIPIENQTIFMLFLIITALFIPFASANVVSTVYDVTLPEVRSTALAIESFIENGGAALAPLFAGVIAKYASLHIAILSICVSAWLLGTIFLALTAYLVPNDIATLRSEMRSRAEFERQSHVG